MRGKATQGGGSHIGMIIHSTTLDTEAKVIAVYGGTTWIQHSGYMLRGGTSDVVANSAVKTGGADTHTLTIQEMPSHNHGMPYQTNASSGATNWGITTTGAQTGSTVTNNTGGGQAHNNIPNYKSVYIWERTG